MPAATHISERSKGEVVSVLNYAPRHEGDAVVPCFLIIGTREK
jgi:hypothetical protein